MNAHEPFEHRAKHWERKFSRQIAMALINAERDRQDQKWGPIETFDNRSAERWLAILMEEVGELAQATLESERGPADQLPQMEIEASHVGAVAASILEWIDRKKQNERKGEID